MKLDHIVVTARNLEDGAAAVEAALGVPLQAGGRHPLMATHNRLLSLGETYLEVIATDPVATVPDHPRWFGLDTFDGAPRLSHWVTSVPDLEATLSSAPIDAGAIHDLSRGDLSWRMAIPPLGVLPFDGVLPTLMEWRGDRAQDRLTPRGCGLRSLVLTHPRMGDIRAAWPALADLDGVTLEVGQRASIRAEIDTPGGRRHLGGDLS